MTHSDDLIAELQQARAVWRKCEMAEQEAREAYLEAKRAKARATDVIGEILMEIETGRSNRPILEAASKGGGE